MARIEREKKLAARAATELVEDGMIVGLGTGTTVAQFLPVLAARKLSLHCVATSPSTEALARRLGLRIARFSGAEIDIAVDGADQISPEGWLVKGGGGAHTREKLVARAAVRFVVIADSTKPVSRLHPPIPLELLAFGLESSLSTLETATRRDAPLSPDGGVIADFTGAIDDPADLARRLDATPGVVAHGLFPPEMVTTILVGEGDDVRRMDRPFEAPGKYVLSGNEDVGGTVTAFSARSVAETVALFREAMEAQGMKVFAVIDQQDEAHRVGLELRPTTLMIFGNPAGGTPVMNAAPLSALDLPLKILVWSDDGRTKVSYEAPQAIAARYDLHPDLASRLFAIVRLTDSVLDEAYRSDPA